MYSGQSLINFAKNAKKNGVKYLFGGNYEVLTPERLSALQANSPSHISNERYNYALNNYIGKVVADCSGLIYGYLKDPARRTSAQLYNKAAVKNTINFNDFSSIPPGAVLWKNGHVGIYQGGGKTIEGYGFKYDIVERDLKNTDFTHYLLFNDFDYTTKSGRNWLLPVLIAGGLLFWLTSKK